MVLGIACHFAIGSRAFRVGRVFLNLACIRRGGGVGVNPWNAWFSAPAVGSKIFFFQNVDL